jgi:hypothetical protein
MKSIWIVGPLNGSLSKLALALNCSASRNVVRSILGLAKPILGNEFGVVVLQLGCTAVAKMEGAKCNSFCSTYSAANRWVIP